MAEENRIKGEAYQRLIMYIGISKNQTIIV